MNKCSIINHLLGSRCHLCGAPAAGLCADCRDALPRNDRPCPVCALPLPTGAPADTHCAACQRESPAFDRVVAPLLYVRPVDDLIAGLKYHHRLHLTAPLADCLVEAIVNPSGIGEPEALVPVPMPARNLRERGFNQAAELARVVARELDLVVMTDLLQRVGTARHQRGLARSDRRRNLRGAFVSIRPPPSRIAVVDDVVTTGATANEISRTLRAAGAKHIEIWSVARTPGRA